MISVCAKCSRTVHTLTINTTPRCLEGRVLAHEQLALEGCPLLVDTLKKVWMKFSTTLPVSQTDHSVFVSCMH